MPARTKASLLLTVLAAFSFEIKNVKRITVSSKNEEVEVFLGITDLPSESYFRVAWQKEEGKAYFGYLKVDENWVKIKSLSDDCLDYYYLADTGTDSATLITKIGEEEELESGIYFLRAHRFTSTCKSHKASTNNFEVKVDLPVLTSPESSLEPSPEPSPQPTPVSPSPSPRGVELAATLSGEVRGLFKGLYLLDVSPSPETLTEPVKSQPLPKIFLGAGLLFLFLGGGWACYNLTKGRIRRG